MITPFDLIKIYEDYGSRIAACSQKENHAIEEANKLKEAFTALKEREAELEAEIENKVKDRLFIRQAKLKDKEELLDSKIETQDTVLANAISEATNELNSKIETQDTVLAEAKRKIDVENEKYLTQLLKARELLDSKIETQDAVIKEAKDKMVAENEKHIKQQAEFMAAELLEDGRLELEKQARQISITQAEQSNAERDLKIIKAKVAVLKDTERELVRERSIVAIIKRNH